jgi:hypothetical protein
LSSGNRRGIPQKQDAAAIHRFLLILWAALAMSVVLYFLLAKFMLRPPEQPNPGLARILAVPGVVALILSVAVKRVFLARAAAQRDSAALRAGYLIALALSEAPAVLGLVIYLTTGWEYSWVLFLIAGAGFALHFPARGAVAAILGEPADA